MRTSVSCTRSRIALVCAAVALTWGVDMSAQSTHDVSVVLARVGERLEHYYKRIQNILCTETLTAQDISSDLSPIGFARVVESELRVEADGGGEGDGAVTTDAKVVRLVQKINGRAPKPKEKEGCYDPNPLSPEPLAFLLPAGRGDYAFTWGGFGKGKDQHLMIIEFRSSESGPGEITEPEGKREGCLSLTVPGRTEGRIWVDASTHDVVRMEERLVARTDLRVPFVMQRRHNLPYLLSIDRYTRYFRYKPVSFEDPAEVIVLPESIEELTVLRGAGSHRTRQVFSEYKRFVTNARLIK